MSLLDPQLTKTGILERLSLRSTLLWSIGVFGFLTVVGPWLAFGTFTAKDQNGLITTFLGVIAVLWLLSGVVSVATAVAAAMRWWQQGHD
jgi:hypothetical protein